MNNIKENGSSANKGPFLSKEAMEKLRLGEAKIRENTAKTEKILDNVLPYASGETFKIRCFPHSVTK